MRSFLASLLTVLLLALPVMARPRGSLDGQVGPRGSLERVPRPSGSLEPYGGFADMVGGTGGEATLAALYAMTNLSIYPTSGAHYYFSCAAGGDLPLGNDTTGDGSAVTPYAQWAKASTLLNASPTAVFWFTFDAGDDACFTFAAAADMALTSLELPGSKTVLLRIDSTTAGNRATIAQSGAPTTAVVHAIDGNSSGGPDLAGGRIAYQDLQLNGFTRPGFINDDGIDVMALNIGWVAADGSAEELIRPAADSNSVCLNCEMTAFNNAPYSPQESTYTTLIGTGLITMSTPAAGTGSMVMLGSNAGSGVAANGIAHHTVIGHSFMMPPTNTGSRAIVAATADNSFAVYLAMARVEITGATAGTSVCLRWDESNQKTFSVNVWQSTVFDCDIVMGVNSNVSATAVSSSTYRGFAYNILDGGAGISKFLEFINRGSVLAGTWLAYDNLVHSRSGPANFFRFRNSADSGYEVSTNLAGWESDINGDAGGITVPMTGAFYPAASTTPLNANLQLGARCTDTLGAVAPVCVAGSQDASGAGADGYCDESSTPESCRPVTVYDTCAGGQACATPPVGSPTYTVPIYAPIWKEALPGATADLANLTLTAIRYGAR